MDGITGVASPAARMHLTMTGSDRVAPGAQGTRKETLFDQYAHRIKTLVPFLKDEDTEMLGNLYAAADQGPNRAQALKKVDELAPDIALQRMQEKDEEQRAKNERETREKALAELAARAPAAVDTRPDADGHVDILT